MTPKHPPEPGLPPERPVDDTTPAAALETMRRGRFAGIWHRVVLTYRYLGWRTLALRVLTYPLRCTPLRHRLQLGRGAQIERVRATAWYREKGQKVTVVFPSYGDPSVVATAVESIRKTTPRGLVDIVIADDASAPEHVAALRRIEGVKLVLGEENVGFAANANRGIGAADPQHDVVLLNTDVVALKGWLACLQYAAYTHDGIGIVGGKLLYPDGRIQHAGVERNLGAPQW